MRLRETERKRVKEEEGLSTLYYISRVWKKKVHKVGLGLINRKALELRTNLHSISYNSLKTPKTREQPNHSKNRTRFSRVWPIQCQSRPMLTPRYEASNKFNRVVIYHRWKNFKLSSRVLIRYTNCLFPRQLSDALLSRVISTLIQVPLYDPLVRSCYII